MRPIALTPEWTFRKMSRPNPLHSQLSVTAPPALIACHDCDLLQRETALQPGGTAVCSRCNAVLYRNNPGNVERTLAITIAAAILFAISNALPIVGIESRGDHNTCTLFGAVLTLWNDHMELIAGLVFITTILFPALELAMMIVLLATPRPPPLVLRLVLAARPWAMVEVFMLGLLVSVQKLSHLATIVPDVALWSFGALMVLFSALRATFNVGDIWRAMPLDHAHADQ
jgi:paraquat-inducible protein A